MYRLIIEKYISYERASLIKKIILQPIQTLKVILARLFRKFSKQHHLSFLVKAKLFTGEDLNVILPEDISTAIYCYGFFEADLSRIILDRVKTGMIFFDIGAHVGYYSKLASNLVGKKGQVHAFEPTPSTFAILKSNFTDTPNVFLQNLAVWSETTELTLFNYGLQLAGVNSFTEPRISKERDRQQKQYEFKQPFEVQATSVDRYVNEFKVKPDFIKIDAESAEYQILVGMKKTLNEIRPQITLEVGDFNIKEVVSSDRIINHLLEQGYKVYTFRNGKIESYQPQNSYLSENLLFIPKEKESE